MSYYPHPQNVYQPPPLPPQSGMATTGFVLSVTGCVLGFLGFGLFLCPLGIIFSGVGMNETSKGRKRGQGLATAGLVLGIFGLVVSLLILSIAVRGR